MYIFNFWLHVGMGWCCFFCAVKNMLFVLFLYIFLFYCRNYSSPIKYLIDVEAAILIPANKRRKRRPAKSDEIPSLCTIYCAQSHAPLYRGG